MKNIGDIGIFTPGDYKEEALCAYRQQARIAERLEVILPFLLSHVNLAEEAPDIFECATELNLWLECVKP